MNKTYIITIHIGGMSSLDFLWSAISKPNAEALARSWLYEIGYADPFQVEAREIVPWMTQK